ncbi:olfactomedin-like protein 1 [Discoglossus pictus]
MVLFYFQFLFIFILNQDRNLRCKAQDETMARYIETRILAIEDRLYKCERDIQQHIQEFKEMSHKLVRRLDRFNKYKTEVKNEIENLLVRVERAEWDIDYLETTNSVNSGLEVDEELVEDQFLEHDEDKRKIKMKINTSCNTMLAHVKSQKTVKKTGGAFGSWIKNVGNDSQKIYVFSGAKNNFLLEFANIKDFTSRDYLQRAVNISLPYFWHGTGQVLYKNSLFFHQDDTLNQIIKYNPWKDGAIQSMHLPGAGHLPPYQLSPFIQLDLAVDEHGLWAIHADSSLGGTIVLTKVDHDNMVATQVWNTSCESNNAEAAFVICGTLYVVYNSPSGGRSHIDCIYDTSGLIDSHDTPVLYFPKRYSSHSSMHYNPTEQTLYSWDEGYQILYRFDTRAKFESSLD